MGVIAKNGENLYEQVQDMGFDVDVEDDLLTLSEAQIEDIVLEQEIERLRYGDFI